MMDRARYSTLKRSLEALLGDFEILAGNDLPAAGASMRDVIGTAMLNAGALHAELKLALAGRTESFMVYPSPSETLEEKEQALGYGS
jgi:hypothetical protein